MVQQPKATQQLQVHKIAPPPAPWPRYWVILFDLLWGFVGLNERERESEGKRSGKQLNTNKCTTTDQPWRGDLHARVGGDVHALRVLLALLFFVHDQL